MTNVNRRSMKENFLTIRLFRKRLLYVSRRRLPNRPVCARRSVVGVRRACVYVMLLYAFGRRRDVTCRTRWGRGRVTKFSAVWNTRLFVHVENRYDTWAVSLRPYYCYYFDSWWWGGGRFPWGMFVPLTISNNVWCLANKSHSVCYTYTQ